MPGGVPPPEVSAIGKQYLERAVVVLPPGSADGEDVTPTEQARLREADPYPRYLSESVPSADQFRLADIWCMPVSSLSPSEVGAFRATGEQIWWRADTQTRPPVPTYVIDDEGVCPRLIAWLQALYRVDGIWCPRVTRWSRRDDTGRREPVDVWEDAETVPGANGAGYLLYPGTAVGVDGPVSSIRLEMIREGVEDLLCFHLLESRLDDRAGALGVGSYQFGRERVAELVRRVATSTTSVRRDPALLSQARLALLRSLELARSAPTLLLRMQPDDASRVIYPGEGIRLVGATLPSATVTVNDHPVTTNEQGVFRAKAYPLPGENEFAVRASTEGGATEVLRRCTVAEDRP